MAGETGLICIGIKYIYIWNYCYSCGIGETILAPSTYIRGRKKDSRRRIKDFRPLVPGIVGEIFEGALF